ncbi:MAG: cupin domain-containing protein [Elusimicrobia bacterium]|nr:cupin domain-containing protein [Elusimicrobiota bacterium]MDE2237694.1 cupin domain-containing protein [Elusimicrobiota bacterium]MDE2424634.1 cupin domain-containing protein [Elusimicrobiota bacterium]
MGFLLAALLAAPCLGAAPIAAVVRQASGLDWKVTGMLPEGLATHQYHLLYENPATGAILTLVRFSRGYVLPTHRHASDETVVVLKGKLEVDVDGQAQTLGPGGYAMIPAGTWHAFKARGWRGCELVVGFSGPMDFQPATPPLPSK